MTGPEQPRGEQPRGDEPGGERPGSELSGKAGGAEPEFMGTTQGMPEPSGPLASEKILDQAAARAAAQAAPAPQPEDAAQDADETTTGDAQRADDTGATSPAEADAAEDTAGDAAEHRAEDTAGDAAEDTKGDAAGDTKGDAAGDGRSAPEPGGEQSSAELTPSQHAEHRESGGIVAGRSRRGMFGIRDSGDTSGYGGLRLPAYVPPPATRPYGGWFDALTDALAAAATTHGLPADAVQQVTVDRGEITFYVRREQLLALCRLLRDDPSLRFELCSSVSGVDYGVDVPQRLHVVYHLTSMTFRRRIRLEVALDVDDPHVPSVVEVYPTADWQERETWDMFGVVFDGHPALTRILMPDDWDGYPQRKDYPLGGIPVEYKGAEIPPPDQRRTYS